MASRPNSVRPFAQGRVAELGPLLTGFFLVVVVIAGGSSVALLVWPAHSDHYFSWDLGASPAAALIGGLYLASVVVFAEALTRPRNETRSLSLGILGLALPTLLFTAVHSSVFDWTRPQAVLWVILFLSAPLSILFDLRVPTNFGAPFPTSVQTRVTLAAVSLSSLGLAVGLWAEPTRFWLAPRSPIPLAGLTSDYLGAWCSFVSVTAAVALIRGRRSDVRQVGVLLGSVSVGAGLAAVRTASDLGPNAATYSTGLIGLAAIAIALLLLSQPKPLQTKEAHRHAYHQL